MFRVLALCAVMVSQLGGENVPSRPEPDKRLGEWDGKWVVLAAQSSSGQRCPDNLLAINEAGTEVVVNGNQVLVAEKLCLTLTTDFSASGLDLDKAVFTNRRPVLMTSTKGRGVLCAYDIYQGNLNIRYPHTMGGVGAGTLITLARQRQ